MSLARRFAAVLAVLMVVSLSGDNTAARPAHDKAFWKAIADNKYAVPAGVSAAALIDELSGYLGSPDPELRDDIAYTTLVNWIYRDRIVPVGLRRRLVGEWTRNLSNGIGEQGTDTVFRRSFSALALGVLAILDNEAPYLEKPEFDALLTSALTYLRAERDTRGFDPAKGWIHSVAHTADLLKFLGRNRHLVPAQQKLILDGVAAKMDKVAGVLTHGEDERLARAVLSICARPDFDEAAFRAWVPALVPVRSAEPPTPAVLAAGQNRRNLAVSLYAVLSTDSRDLAGIRAAREIVLATLKKFM
jgi:hypothetical protein